MKFLEHEIAYRKSTLNHLSRREALMKMGSGFGTLGLASLIGNSNAAQDSASPLAPKKPHFEPRATNNVYVMVNIIVSEIHIND